MKGTTRQVLRKVPGTWQLVINLNSRTSESHFLSFSASCPALLNLTPDSSSSALALSSLAASVSSKAGRTIGNRNSQEETE